MSEGGWIVLHKKVLDTSFYKDTYAFYLAIHILLKATWRESVFLSRNSEVILHRGQYLGGYKRLAKELHWGKTKVRRNLGKLIEAKFVSHYFNNLYSIITVTNYNYYQNPNLECPSQTPEGVPIEHSVSLTDPLECRPQTPSSAAGGPHYNKVKQTKEYNILSSHQNLWDAYPKKLGKKEALRHLKSSVKTEEDVEKCFSALKNYKNSKSYGQGYVQYGSTWFNNWQDWINDPDPGEDPAITKMKESLK